ncbi:MAG: hypothetical protein CGU29_08425 [Candidatus Dactylopiibacterium carminicum]|uniref:PEP-CTERM sorting domain-containing protein n=1 Tax=Candidatus Dactylopiibacterium carminicum TaxID=857335 RepID=A0A272ET23_9RHOO|nr:PEP-CTERM sorting domain-containing protein [Candidatus Dactylopiibacterium carminicum]PAS93255.1 MAG: hypothetical protein CGU29_08425 [Candidatus Dactylopiibacterium carminicum]
MPTTPMCRTSVSNPIFPAATISLPASVVLPDLRFPAATSLRPAAAATTPFTLVAQLSKTGGSTTYNSLTVSFYDAANNLVGSTTATGNSGLSSISTLGLRSANLDAGDSVTVSGLKLGTTLAAVSPVPEASTYAMMLAGLAMMGFIARRRIRD